MSRYNLEQKFQRANVKQSFHIAVGSAEKKRVKAPVGYRELEDYEWHKQPRGSHIAYVRADDAEGIFKHGYVLGRVVGKKNTIKEGKDGIFMTISPDLDDDKAPRFTVFTDSIRQMFVENAPISQAQAQPQFQTHQIHPPSIYQQQPPQQFQMFQQPFQQSFQQSDLQNRLESLEKRYEHLFKEHEIMKKENELLKRATSVNSDLIRKYIAAKQ
jgi:hypothetical protein